MPPLLPVTMVGGAVGGMSSAVPELLLGELVGCMLGRRYSDVCIGVGTAVGEVTEPVVGGSTGVSVSRVGTCVRTPPLGCVVGEAVFGLTVCVVGTKVGILVGESVGWSVDAVGRAVGATLGLFSALFVGGCVGSTAATGGLVTVGTALACRLGVGGCVGAASVVCVVGAAVNSPSAVGDSWGNDWYRIWNSRDRGGNNSSGHGA